MRSGAKLLSCAAVVVVMCMLSAGCGDSGPVSNTELGDIVNNLYDDTGLLKDQAVERLLKYEGATDKEKIQELMKVIKEGPVNRHAGAAEMIRRIEDPYRVDALIEVLETYDGPRSTAVIVNNQALMGLGISLDRRAFKKMYEILDTSDDVNLLGSVLHKLGVAPYNAKALNKPMSDEFYNEIGEQISRMLQHENKMVREHANRALSRWKRRVDMLPSE